MEGSDDVGKFCLQTPPDCLHIVFQVQIRHRRCTLVRNKRRSSAFSRSCAHRAYDNPSAGKMHSADRVSDCVQDYLVSSFPIHRG